jgi:hypothetical protein
VAHLTTGREVAPRTTEEPRIASLARWPMPRRHGCELFFIWSDLILVYNGFYFGPVSILFYLVYIDPV